VKNSKELDFVDRMINHFQDQRH